MLNSVIDRPSNENNIVYMYIDKCYKTSNGKQEKFEDTTGVIRSHKSKKDRQHNGKKKKDKRTNNDLQNIT